MTETGSQPAAPEVDISSMRCVWNGQARLGEGVLWSPRRQQVFWVDILSCQIHALHVATGTHHAWRLSEEVSALAEREESSELLIAMRSGLAHWSPDAHTPAPPIWVRPETGRTGNRFNDGACDAKGRFWVGSMDFDCQKATGALYRVTPDGQSARLEDGFPVTNGPVWVDEGCTMLFTDTAGATVFAYPFDPERGTLGPRRVWLQLAPEDGLPDGMTVDAAGRVWLCHWGGGCVTCRDPVSARELARVELPVSQVTRCAFGDDDLRTLYVTTAREGLNEAALAREPMAGGLFAVRVSQAGVAPARMASS
ncbi:SMP-30/gluconolactonase/LRE family protein [Hydrogenophaga sp. 5NK40-0174]|uniref:SMP-30/gluconolactonase/LRE family protein n=1 Tax=Hydrogenophaga sp. 5NK40-0174 TaxID=3127649 RepID=UPI003106F6B6